MAQAAGAEPRAPETRRSIRTNLLFTLIGNGVFNACRLGVVVLLAKFAGPVVQGHYLAALAWSTPIVLFFTLELRGALVADAADRTPFGAYRRLRDLGLGLAAVVLLGVVLAQPDVRADSALLALFVAVCASKLLYSWAELYWGLLQKRERLDWVGWSNALRGVAALLPFAVMLPMAGAGQTQAAAAAAGVQALAWALLGWFIDRRVALHGVVEREAVGAGALLALAWRVLPLGLVALLVNLCENVPRLMIDAQPDGARDLGFFGALAFLPMIGQFLVVQAALSSANRLAQAYQGDRREFRRLTLKLVLATLALSAAILAATWIGGAWLLRVTYTPEYAAYFPQFRVLVAAQCVVLLGSIFGAVVTQMQRFWVQVPIQITVLAATVAAAAAWIPADPVGGAAWTMMVRAAVQTALYAACLLLGLRAAPAQPAAPVAAD